MPQSYSEIYFHAVFAVKYRQAVIDRDWEERLYGNLWTKLLELDCSPIAVGGIEDHVHVFWRHTRTQTAADVIQRLKGASARFINQQQLSAGHFRWQPGYGLFSVSRFRKELVKSYIERQRQIHHQRTLRQEYERMLLREFVNRPADYQFDPLIDFHADVA